MSHARHRLWPTVCPARQIFRCVGGCATLAVLLGLCFAWPAMATAKEFLTLEPRSPAGTPAHGKHVVLISGDQEYRSEETCPMLGKLLSQRHGFRCTVLFAIDKEGGFINPNETTNIPGMEALDGADLMIIGTRFRDLPDEQLAPLLRYLQAAKPVIGFRTATHAFKSENNFGGFDWNNFGRNVIGDNWVSHHGKHKVQGGRGVIEVAHQDHPILNGVADVFTPSDIYGIQRVTSQNATILLRGAVTESIQPDSQSVAGPQNDPMMPLAWLRSYSAASDRKGRVFATTAGASVDFACEDLRRLVVNAAYHLTGLDVPARADVTPVDPFQPSFFGFHPTGFFEKRRLQVSDFALGRSQRTVP